MKGSLMKGSVKESVKETIPFFKSIWLALNPWRYDELRDKRMRVVFKYFFSFVFLVFVLSIVFMLPTIGGFVNKQLSNFEKLEVSVNATMKNAMILPENNPVVTVDTRKEEGKLKEGRLLITDKYLYVNYPFRLTVERYEIGSYKDLLVNQGIIVSVLLLMLPSLLFLFYMVYAIKVLFIILLATIIGFVISRVAKFEILFGDTLKTGLFAATPMLIIDLIRLPFGFNVYYAQYIAFLIFFIVGMIKVGEFEGRGHRKTHKKKHVV